MVYADEMVRKLENAHGQQTQEPTSFDKDFVYKLLLVTKAYKHISQELKLKNTIDSDITWIRDNCIEVRNILAARYKDGVDFGYTKGYDKGYDVGNENGYDSGFDDGKVEGYDVGYEEGYEEGEEKGYEKGYESGDTDGYDAGRQDGYTEGSAETTAGMKDKFKKLSICKRLVMAFTGNLKIN